MTKRTVLYIAFAVIIGIISTQAYAAGSQESESVTIEDTKTVTDHAGYTVKIPANPKKIASLQDQVITLTLLELDAPIIGSPSRSLVNKSIPHIAGSYLKGNEIYTNTPITQIAEDIHDYGRFSTFDKEIVKVSKPDLIIGTNYQTQYKAILESIAPTIFIDFTRGKEISQSIANWIGKDKKFNELNTQYLERLEEVKAKFAIPPSKQSLEFLYIIFGKDNHFTLSYASSINSVAHDDLGFQTTSFNKKHNKGQWGEEYSIEVIDDIYKEADYIITVYYPEEGDEFAKDEVMEKFKNKYNNLTK